MEDGGDGFREPSPIASPNVKLKGRIARNSLENLRVLIYCAGFLG
jgi:hypothetical protein